MKIIAKYICLLALLLVGIKSYAQADITLYHMKDLPLNNRLNPAFQPKNGSIYIAIPGIPFIGAPTSLDVSMSKNISFGGLLGSVTDLDIFSSKLNYEKIATASGSYATGKLNFGYTPISFGFMVKDMYFSLDVNLKMYAEGRLPQDIMQLLWYGNGDDQTIGKKLSMNGLGAKSYIYGELALGFSKEIAPLDLTVGAKLKYLQGGAYAQATLGKDSYIHTNPNNYHITVGLDPELYIAGIPLNTPEGSITLDSLTSTESNGYKFESGSRGFAFDLGGTWNLGNIVDQSWAKNMDISASLIDVGFINWKGSKVVKATDADDFTFEGMDLNGDFADALMDSIMNMAKVEATGNTNFRKWLSPTLYFGVNYHIFKYLNAGALVGCRFDTYENLPLFAASINTQALPVNASLSASYFDGKGNLGFGIVFGRRGCQFHLITDNILTAVNIKNAQSVNLRMGMNILVGKNREKRLEKMGRGSEALAPEATKTGAPLNPVKQEGATGTKVEGSNVPEITKSNVEPMPEVKSEENSTSNSNNAATTMSNEELLKRAMAEEEEEGDVKKKK